MLSSSAAALALTTLYRSSQQSAKRHYDAGYDSGYLAALDELMSIIQHGVSTSADSASNLNCIDEHAMSIGWVMDWIEARSEAMRSKGRGNRGDEEEENKSCAPPWTPVEKKNAKPHTPQVRPIVYIY